MKNDITYEYRVFTNRLVDVESMEVGKCTSKVLKDLKSKDKVDGRFFHTSDTDEWFFCWNGKLQKLNLKGNADVNSALDEVKKLIDDANIAVNKANDAVADASVAAENASVAAESANKAVETIDNKIAEKANATDVIALTSDVNVLKTSVEDKANKSDVEQLSETVNKIDLSKKADKTELENYAQIGHTHDYATEKFVGDAIAGINIPTVPTKVSDLENDVNYLTEHQLAGYATEKWVGDQGYLTEENLKDAGKSLFDAAGAASSAETTAKAYADGLKTEMNARIDVLEAINHDAYVAADVQVLADAKTYADGLSTNYDAAGAASSAETAAKAYTDSKLAYIEEELERITNKILGV